MQDNLSRWVVGFSAAVMAAYCLLVFPFSFFRHDDWLILGNAVRHLQDNWEFALSPTLFYLEDEVVWFFRPFFKLGVYVFYHLFGYAYGVWLFLLLLMSAGAVWLNYLTLFRLTESRFWSLTGVGLFVACVHLHFGSLHWMGEGMMNCPQLLLISACSYCFVRALEKNTNALWAIVGFLLFVLSLGFKESSVFQLGLIFFLALFPQKIARPSPNRLVKLLLPYAIVGSVFLVVRLFVMPINPYYVPQWSWDRLKSGLFTLLLAFSLPLVVWSFGLWRESREKMVVFLKAPKEFSLFAAFFLVSLLPYLGHTFFSPGWLMVPGYYFMFLLALVGARSGISPSAKTLKQVSVAIFLIGLVPVGMKLYALQWWQWKPSQLHVKGLIESAPSDTRKLIVYNCRNSKHPKLNVDRVIGFEAGLYQMWALHHQNPIPVAIHGCPKSDRVFSAKDKMLLRWEFPQMTWLNPN